MVLVLKEAGVGVLRKLLGVLGHYHLVYLRLLHVNPAPRLAVIGHVDLGVGESRRNDEIVQPFSLSFFQ